MKTTNFVIKINVNFKVILKRLGFGLEHASSSGSPQMAMLQLGLMLPSSSSSSYHVGRCTMPIFIQALIDGA